MGNDSGNKEKLEQPKQLSAEEIYERASAESEQKLGPIMAPLNSMIGAKTAKRQIRDILNQETLNMARGQLGLPVDESAHKRTFVIEGNPGTGKTTVAGVLAKFLAMTGATKKPDIHTVAGGELIKGYVGQSGQEARKLLEKGKGGTILIDEAQQINKESYGPEVIEAIVSFTEENPDTAVILAGYSKKAHPDNNIDLLFKKDPGLARRFPDRVTMDNYTEPERAQILVEMASQGNVPARLNLTPEQMIEVVTDPAVDWTMQNAGGVKNALTKAKRAAANRGSRTKNPRATEVLEPEDFGVKPSTV